MKTTARRCSLLFALLTLAGFTIYAQRLVATSRGENPNLTWRAALVESLRGKAAPVKASQASPAPSPATESSGAAEATNALAPAQSGGSYNLPQSVVAGGGGTSAGGSYTQTGTVGQGSVGESSGGVFSVSGGFWQGSACAAPVISQHPLSQTVCAGSSVTFSVAAMGTGLTYQWRRNGSNIGGATTSSYNLAAAVAGDAGNYDVVVTGDCGSATSNAATLTVNAGAAITQQPASHAVCVTQPATFSVTATGAGLTYQWRKGGVNIGGATASSFSLPAATLADAGTYDVVITAACGSLTSMPATLTVNPATAITTHPASQVKTVGESVTFSVTAAGNGLTYQWRKNGVNLSGATASSYTIASVAPGDAGQYDVAVAGACGAVTSNAATLTVNCQTVTVNPPALPDGQIGAPYSQQLSQTGGLGTITWSSTGALPNNVTLNAATGLLSGTPTASGTFNFTARATDQNGCFGERAYALMIGACPPISITPGTLPAGAVGATYNQALAATGGTPGYTFSLNAGALPGGLSLSSAGVISGAPSASGAFNFTVRATDSNNCSGERGYTLAISGGGLQYYPLPFPVRLLDTRPDPFTSCVPSSDPLTGGGVLTLPTVGNCNGLTIPASAQAVVGNATVVNFQSGGGFITLFPSDAAQPNASNLNFTANHIVPNSFTVGLGGDGAIKIFTSASTNFIVDITGYYAPPGAGGLYFHPLPAPVRLLDTRPDPAFPSCFASNTPLVGGGTLTLPVFGNCNGLTIPASAKALVGNATVVNFQSGGGFITLFPSDATLPNASNLNFTAAHIVPNSFVVGVSASGSFNIFTSATTNFIVDIAGYFSDQAVDANGQGLLFYPLPAPARWLDTRPDPFVSCIPASTPLGAGNIFTLQAQLTCEGQTIPANAKSVLGNATVVNFQSGGGFVTLFPSDATLPNASNLNFTASHIVPNSFVVGLSPDGAFKIFTSGATNFIIDLSGYFAP